jgi:hypothetical protein
MPYQISHDKVQKIRASLQGNVEAIDALDLLEDYDFDTEEALYAVWRNLPENRDIEIEKGRSKFERQIDNAIGEVKYIVCQDQYSQQLTAGMFSSLIEAVVQAKNLPPGLVTAILTYALSKGVEQFCSR